VKSENKLNGMHIQKIEENCESENVVGAFNKNATTRGNEITTLDAGCVK